MKKYFLILLSALLPFSAMSKMSDNSRFENATEVSMIMCGESTDALKQYVDETVKIANQGNEYINVSRLDIMEMLYALQSESLSLGLNTKCKNILTDYQVYAVSAPKDKYTNHPQIMALTLFGLYNRAARQQH